MTKMPLNIIHIASLSVLLWLFKSWTQAEMFSAVVQMEPLLETHKRMITDLDSYILKEEKRLAVLKSHVQIYRIEHDKATEDNPNYLENPINVFSLIKRLTTDLDHIEDSIKVGKEYVKNITLKHADLIYPTKKDLAGAVQAMVRLQATYRLDAHELVEGKLEHSFPMTAADCLVLARVLHHLEDFKSSLVWGKEALRKLKQDPSENTFTEAEILEFISLSYYSMEDLKSALEWSKKLFELDPKHPTARDNVRKYEKKIAIQEKAAGVNQREDTEDEKPKSEALETNDEDEIYEALCRGDKEISSEIAKRLHCRYVTEHHPFLRLAPIKAEQLYIGPDVVIFHEVVSDNEIEVIRNMTVPRLKRATVSSWKDGASVLSDVRTSQIAWLYDEESEVVARVSQRVADMTGLSIASAEPLQVCNYGIGGHYEPHYDFSQEYYISGKRTATVLFYMSNVAQGGATVFTKLGLSVFPVKRAALFWLNLHPSGEGDTATRHAACPVLRGSKWVFTKWLRQSGQEFKKPCNLDDDHDVVGI